MPPITPCLWFDDQGEQAAQLYTSLFANSRITNVSRYGPGGRRPEGMAMTVQFELDGREYVALNGGPEFPQTEAFSLQVFCESQAEIDRYWDVLTADGGVESQCGWLKDRFGVSWQIVPSALGELLGDPDPERSRRATEAMFTMSKIDIEEIRRAAAG
ncbi:VOC family protein [Frankia sp. AgPm24]|uniref:VOC family protein n=1 Tax=Frankia umida TaxID=573489 RepID=A0ABT0JWK7_9ACTN|nr:MULTISPECIES: VOC family protein [Frankia]MCK9875936.1 VOC family protein [Frankia umida]MCK9924402.1 VOC family protein [Frankia sp. AgPm24]